MNGIFTKLDPSNPEARFRTYYDFIPDARLNMNSIKVFFEIMQEAKVNSGIIIMSGKLSQQAKQKINEINSQIQIEVFSLGELVVNITEHEFNKILSQYNNQFYLKTNENEEGEK